MPSRGLHEIEFFSDLVSNAIAIIGQVKEIARHGLEPIQEVVESDESVVILCWRLIREGGSARCGSLNIALLRTAAVFVIRVI
jgi:hypothetical protein